MSAIPSKDVVLLDGASLTFDQVLAVAHGAPGVPFAIASTCANVRLAPSMRMVPPALMRRVCPS